MGGHGLKRSRRLMVTSANSGELADGDGMGSVAWRVDSMGGHGLERSRRLMVTSANSGELADGDGMGSVAVSSREAGGGVEPRAGIGGCLRM